MDPILKLPIENILTKSKTINVNDVRVLSEINTPTQLKLQKKNNKVTNLVVPKINSLGKNLSVK